MKTKNIFRMLLVAVALLLGADNVKADTTLWSGDAVTSGTCWDNYGGSEGSITISNDVFSAATINVGDKLRVKAALNVDDGSDGRWMLYIATANYYSNLYFTDWHGSEDEKLFSYDSPNNYQDGYFEFTVSEQTITEFRDADKGGIRIHFLGLTVSEVTIGSGSVTPTPTGAFKVNLSYKSSEGRVTASQSTADTSDLITITVIPNDGYDVNYVMLVQGTTGKNLTPTSTTDGTYVYTFRMPTSDVTVNVTFYQPVTEETVTIGSTGFATFCSDENLDFTYVTGMKAYIVKAVADGYAQLEQITGTVAAQTGMILMGSTQNVPFAKSGTQYSNNLLKAVTSKDVTVSGAGRYVLVPSGGSVKFAETASQSAKVTKGHAYLDASASGTRLRFLGLAIDGETTAIQGVEAQSGQQDAVYNLSGQRVSNPTRGIYIINGKKVVIK